MEARALREIERQTILEKDGGRKLTDSFKNSGSYK